MTGWTALMYGCVCAVGSLGFLRLAANQVEWAEHLTSTLDQHLHKEQAKKAREKERQAERER